jgi:energy-converting hydrogenase Eha subunit A
MTLIAIVLLVAIAMGCVASALRRMPDRPHGSWYLLAFVPAVVAATGQGAVFVSALREYDEIPIATMWSVLLLDNASFLFGAAMAAAIRRRRAEPVGRRG